MSRPALLAPLALTVTLAATSGCVLPSEQDAALEGDKIADYRISAALTLNECGAGYMAPATLSFLAQLREEPDSTRAYWKLPEGPLITGTLTDDVFRFEQTTVHPTIRAEPDLGIVGCTLYRTETVEASISDDADADAGVAENASFTGETRIRVGPNTGSDCSAVLLALGGNFPTLPCEIRYDLSGAATDELEDL